MAKLYWEVAATVTGGSNTDIIPCRGRKSAEKAAAKAFNTGIYEMVYIQAHDGSEIIIDYAYKPNLVEGE